MSTPTQPTPRLLWKHPAPRLTRLDAFRRFVNRSRGLNLRDYYDFHAYSVSEYAFWEDVWRFVGIIYSSPPTAITAPNPVFPLHPIWFPGSKLNYAENLLWRDTDAVALTAFMEGEGELSREEMTFRELRVEVTRWAGALRACGVKVGDRVAAIVPNAVYAVVLTLAVTSIGAIFTSTSPDMGAKGILSRFHQITPIVLFSTISYRYAGRTHSVVSKLAEVVHGLEGRGLERVVLLPGPSTPKERIDIPKSLTLNQFLFLPTANQPLRFEQLPFSHPAYILYSSGTTGQPKCIIHSGGGVLLQTKKEIALTYNCGLDDTHFQFTTTGWMMFPLMLSALGLGTRLILYDGSPFYPSPTNFIKLIGEEGVTCLGTSPRFLSEIQGRGIKPLSITQFPALQSIMSTGSVLTAPLFEWTQEAFGKDVQILSGSGGTDICAPLVSGVSTLPVYAGEIQGKCLGMAISIFSPSGESIEHTGDAGELVCTRPHPSLPLGFWGDEKGEKLRAAYYDTFPGIWRQGDFILMNAKTKGLMILGRSDGVLNPSGVRFGSGEIYAVLEQFSTHIDDSICVGRRRPQDTDERVLLFLKMRDGQTLTEDLTNRIKDAIKTSLSTRHIPKGIFQVPEIPYTVNGKKIEIAVKQIVSGMDVVPSGTVANPESLKLYYKYRNAETFESVREARAKL